MRNGGGFFSGTPLTCGTIVLLAVLSHGYADAQSPHCRRNDPRIGEALDRIARAADPCGESVELRAVLDRLDGCHYQICTSESADRNVFDRPSDASDAGTITWNPDLRSPLEEGCDDDRAHALQRDPTASLLHELVHAGQACAGLNPGDYELEAVRIENIYRRAAGLCQRTSYGDTPLPLAMVRTCRSIDIAKSSRSKAAANRVHRNASITAAPDRSQRSSDSPADEAASQLDR